MISERKTTQRKQISAVVIIAIVIGATAVTSVVFTGSAVAAAGNGPAVGVSSPAADANLDSQPVIRGKATDDGSVDTVELSIRRENGEYYDGNGWTSSNSPVWITVSGTTDWTYDVYDGGDGITTDGVYTVTARATDNNGQTQSEPFGKIGADPTEITYTVDTQSPSITTVDVTDEGTDDTVEPGETVRLSADVSDATAGVETVTTNASRLGGPSELKLVPDGGNTYTASFVVSEPQVGDGDVPLIVTAEDSFGHTATGSDLITLDTDVASVDTLSVNHEFIGIVKDDGQLRVTADGVKDDQGNRVDDDTATVKVAGQTYDVGVTDGEIDATIDPTKISDTANTGKTDVALADSTASVTLVHEVNGLEKGYQVGGTPMPASDVLVENVNDVTAYDPTDESWSQPEELRAGEGYYIDAASNDARIGYEFDEDASKTSQSWLLDQGYNLVGASPNMNNGESVEVTNDLGADITPSESDIEVRLPKDSASPGDRKGLNSFKSPAADTDTADAYDAYWIYVDSNEDYVRTTVEVAYDPSEQG